MSTQNTSLLKLTLYMTSAIGILGNALVSPALGAMKIYFHDVDPLLIRFIISISSISIIPSALFANSLAKRFGNKNLLIFAILLFGIAGVSTAFFSNIYAVLVSRSFLGFGMGLISPLSQSYPNYLFSGDEKNTVLARQGASISLSNFICAIFAGYLASLSWRYSFGIYGLAFLVALLAFITLPEVGKVEKTQNIEKNDKKENDKFPKNALINIIGIGFYFVFFYVIITNNALLIQEKNLGSPALAGYTFALMNLFSFLVGYNFNRFYKILGRATILFGTISMSLCFMLMAISTSVYSMFFSNIISALFMGIIMPYNNIDIARKIEKHLLVKVLSMQMVCLSLGQFISPIFFNFLPAFPNFTEISGKYMTVACISFIFSILLALYLLFTKNKQKKEVKL